MKPRRLVSYSKRVDKTVAVVAMGAPLIRRASPSRFQVGPLDIRGRLSYGRTGVSFTMSIRMGTPGQEAACGRPEALKMKLDLSSLERSLASLERGGLTYTQQRLASHDASPEEREGMSGGRDSDV